MKIAAGGLFVLAAALMFTGCATDTKNAKVAIPITGDPLEDGKARLKVAPARDKVLWEYRTALEAIRRGQFDEARQMLDEALTEVGGIIGPDKSGKRARSNFVAESQKRFIGEPYERVMAYFYRGILYWRDGELDNARACFMNAQFQDSDAEKNEYKSDYVLLDYLTGYASAKLGGDGSDALNRAQSLSKTQKLPPYDTKANVFFFVEMGFGPTKFATGEFRQQLRFKHGSSDSCAAAIEVETGDFRAPAYDDISFQASSRGGRVMDHVLANKAMFKSTAGTIGNIALAAGAATLTSGVAMNNSNASMAGASLLVVGLIAKGIEKASNPAADTRDWNNLPQYLGFAAAHLEPGEHQVTVEFLDEAGIPFADWQTVKFKVERSKKDTVVILTDRPRTEVVSK